MLRNLLASSVAIATALALGSPAGAQSFALDSLDGLELHGVLAEATTFQDRRAVRIVEDAGQAGGNAVAVLTGIAFCVAGDVSQLECFYLRPTNGRAEDQLRRNHSAHYVSHPDHPWYRLREETPGQYESYVDLVPGEWTKVRVEVDGAKARLFVHGAEQPTLIANDLKLGTGRGAVALWIGQGTEAFFTDLLVTRR